jgi:voltage-gated potassium channel
MSTELRSPQKMALSRTNFAKAVRIGGNFNGEDGEVVSGHEPKARGRGWRQVYSERRFAILLVIFFVLLAGPPVFMGFSLSAELFDGVMSLLMLAAIVSLCFEPHQRLFALILGIPTIILSLGGHTVSGTISVGILLLGHLCAVLFFFGAAALIVKSLFYNRTINFDSILGSICGYLFLGLAWAVLYVTIENLHPGSFEISRSLATESKAARPLPHVLTYYSFVTLTTVGYGDITPVTSVTRTLSWIEATTGQFYLAVIVAAVVSLLVPTQDREKVNGSRS